MEEIQVSKIHNTTTARQCSNSVCRHSQRVSHNDFFMTRVPGPHGGSRNAPAFRCSACAHTTAIDPRSLTRRALSAIPSEQTYDERLGALAWETGARGRNLLQQRIAGGLKAFGYALAYKFDGEQVKAEPFTLSERRDLLSRLDDEDIDLLLISGIGSDGRRWRTVFHSKAGASSFRGTIDPIPTTVRAILSLAGFPKDPIAIAA
ncbi:hypothetical protein DVR09_15905 (plasmid) [Erythrobacter aureus]|uniref:Uncharacterized protein n=2 Tax=Erythrobacter aureus TaxID=2182384 RepID=A0A345YJ36_9SPHN|nr:hypothetical protein DVR09_15905 [Erythrobacter aureus]